MALSRKAMSEADLVRRIIRHVEENGGKAIKIHGNEFVEAGTPDVLGSLLVEGRLRLNFLLEVKLPGNEPEPIQHYRLKQWEEAGMYAGWCDSFDGFVGFLEEIAAREDEYSCS